MARVLLVDDEATVLELLKTVLELDEHEVTTARDGNAALAAMANASFDVIVTDIVMPDREGIGLIMEIQKLKPNIPIIAMSGGGRGSVTDYLEMAALLGARRTLSKPFSTQELLDAVRDVLAS